MDWLIRQTTPVCTVTLQTVHELGNYNCYSPVCTRPLTQLPIRIKLIRVRVNVLPPPRYGGLLGSYTHAHHVPHLIPSEKKIGAVRELYYKRKPTTKLLWLRARASKGCAAVRYCVFEDVPRPVRRAVNAWLHL